MKKLLDEKKLGRLCAVDLSVKCYRDQAYYDSAPYRGDKEIDGGGPFIQQAAHNVDMYCWFFGMPEEVVSALDTFAHNIEGEDHGVALLRHADGMIGTITASTVAKPGFPARLEIHAVPGESARMASELILKIYSSSLATLGMTGADVKKPLTHYART